MGSLIDAALLLLVLALLEARPAPHADDPAIVLRIAGAGRVMALSAADLRGATAALEDGAPALRFSLSAQAGRDFAALTGAAAGGTIAISVCGAVLSEPRVARRIDGGAGILALGSPEEAVRLAAVLRGERRCPGPPLLLSAPSGSAEIPQEGILQARAYLDDRDLPVVEIRLDGDASRPLAAMTEANFGETMSVARCGIVLTAPVILTPIPGPELLISGGPSYGAARDLAAALASAAPCPP